MKFGKLENIEQVNFQLPSDAEGTGELLRKLPQRKEPLQLYVGCTGWNMKEWIGSLYPPKTKSEDFLYYYSRQFGTIELNTTHYRIPTLEIINKWRKTSPEHFRFCPKIPQTISHSRDLGLSKEQTQLFCENVSELGDKLGCCFMQLPPYFGFDRLNLLERFLANFPKQIPLAVELRHESWFAEPEKTETLGRLLEKYQISPVITDVAGRRDVLHQRLTTDTALIRFVGNALHATDYSRIDEWVERLADWHNKGLKQVFFFPHEPDNILAPRIAAYFIEKINIRCGLNMHIPSLDGSCSDTVRPDGQMSLF